MIALVIIVLVLAMIAFTRLGIVAVWDGQLTLRLIIGPARITLSSSKNKTQEKAKRAARSENETVGKEKKSPWPRLLRAHWRELLELVSRVLSMPVLDPLIIKVTFGGDDPVDNAMNYGRAWALIGVVVPFLESNFKIGKRELDVTCDNATDKLSVFAKAAVTARVGQCAMLVFSALMLFLRLYRHTKQSEKAVQI